MVPRFAAVLALLSLAIHAPFVSTFPVTWDSVLYLRALERFAPAVDPTLGQPHPPGYLFYVLLARAAATLLGDPYAGLVAVSVVAAALACAAGAILVAALAGRAAGLLAGALLLASPLLSYYALIAYPYTLLGLLSTVVAGLAWWARDGPPRRLMLAAGALGVLAGFRPDLLLLAPLGAYVASRSGPRPVLLAGVACALACLTWIVPTGAAVGGVDRFFAITAQQFVANSAPTGGQSAGQNVVLAVIGVGAQAFWLVPFTVIGALHLARTRRDLAGFLLWWSLPPLAFYLVAHIGEFGYALMLAAPLALLTATGILALLELARPARAVVAAAIVALLVLNASAFALSAGLFSIERVRANERELTGRLELVRSRFSPAETTVLAELWFMHVLHYLPEYRSELISLRPHADVRTIVPADGPRVVAIFDREIPVGAGVRVSLVDDGVGRHVRAIQLSLGELLLQRDGVLTLAR